MASDTDTPEVNIIHILLDKSEGIASRIYKSAYTFLFLGMAVAIIGVVYFYFSNDALILDRTLLESRISKLEDNNKNLNTDNTLLAKAFDKRVDLQANNSKSINEAINFSSKTLLSYIDFYNEVAQPYNGNISEKIKQINYSINKHSKLIDNLNKEVQKLHTLTNKGNETNKEIGIIMDKYGANANNIDTLTRPTSSYDKPELIFSPKLIYGFFSRLGGLIFIELIAFYLLKQYRVNMDDFKYYDNIARKIRYDLYLSRMAEKLDDEKLKIDIVSKLFNNGVATQTGDNEKNIDGLLPSSDIELITKLLDSIKGFIKK